MSRGAVFKFFDRLSRDWLSFRPFQSLTVLLDLDLDLYIAGTIFGHFCNELGERNANIYLKKLLKKNVCVVPFYSPYFKYLKTG